MKNINNYWKLSNFVGLILVILFFLCFAWYYINPVEQELHLKLLQMTFFGFVDMSFGTFILGAVQSYIFGYILAGIYELVNYILKNNKK